MFSWCDLVITDKDIKMTDIDERVFAPYEECGTVFQELFHYAIEPNTLEFSKIIFKEKEILETPIQLPLKDDKSNFNDLRYTIKSYRYILSSFLSLGIIPKLITLEDDMRFKLLEIDINDRADFLEYILLNNPNKIKKQSSYYAGRLEYELYILIQNMYFLAIKGNNKCRWMLSFNTPLQIWFVLTVQQICLLWYTQIPISNREHYKTCIENIKNLRHDCLKSIELLKEDNAFSLTQALQFTISQLIIESVPPISHYYTNYLEAIKKQAYAISKTNKYRPI